MSSISKRPDGRYILQFTQGGKRYTVYGTTRKECQEKERQKREEITAGTRKSAKELTLDEYFERWLSDKEGTIKDSSIRARRLLYADISSVQIDKAGHTFGELKLQEIETQDVKRLQETLKKGGEQAGRDRFGKPKKAKATRTTNDTISLLSTLLDAAMNERIIQWNAAKAIRGLRRTEPAAAETIHRALSVEDTKLFMETAAATDTWYYNLFIFLLNTGCRVGEAGAVTQSDIQQDEQGNYVLHVHRTITRTETGAWEIGKDTKTAAGNRYIPLNDAALKAIRDQQQLNRLLHPDTEKVLTFDGKPRPIFTGLHGKLLLSSRVNDNIRIVCDAAGLERFTAHCFRDTFVTRCVESGMEVKQLQSIAGHSDIKMTMGLYAHSSESRKAEQLKAVNFM